MLLSAAVHLSSFLSVVLFSWRGWNGALILNNLMLSGSRSFIRDDEPPPPHTFREWREFYAPNQASDGEQAHDTMWYKRDWATEGYRRIAAPHAGHEFDSGYSPDQLSVATQSTTLTMSPELLDAILRSSDAADFSTEELTRLQEGISQQLTARARLVSHPHQPVRALRGSTSLETIGVSDPYRPVNPTDSGRGRMSPVFELTED